MKYVRLFAGPDAESHFEDVNVELAPVREYARGVPQVFLSAPDSLSSIWMTRPCRNCRSSFTS
jgi:hypothetical protein